MPARLDRSGFLRLIEIVGDHPNFATEKQRLSLVRLALLGSERASDVLAGRDLAGNARGAAVELVTRLDRFGCLGECHALALVLAAVREVAGEDLRRELDRFIDTLDGGCRQAPIDALI